jgi:hypothetical protein
MAGWARPARPGPVQDGDPRARTSWVAPARHSQESAAPGYLAAPRQSLDGVVPLVMPMLAKRTISSPILRVSALPR